MLKEQLRSELLRRRKNLRESDVIEKSNAVKELLFTSSEFIQAHIILFYVSYDNEVNTHDMIRESLGSGKNVVVPRVNKNNQTLILSELHRWTELEKGAYNILEPQKENLRGIAVDIIDLILVPGVGFDCSGNRLGHGKGYYDKVLKDATHAVHVGLAFECQLVECIPVEPHDVPVDIIVTEKRVIHCTESA